MTHWSRVTHQEGDSTGIWLPGGGLGRLQRIRGHGRLWGQPSDRLREP
jgi:hypothetical protein